MNVISAPLSASTATITRERAPNLTPGARRLVTGWSNIAEFNQQIMAPLATGGSVVVVTGMASTDRLLHIATAEKADT
ncbi:hypothetical protein [Corynebacterium aquatimens]|uniref:Uncharacterized protein n=1 Tax=Corynebacterium aquatimens TaxID=1190508 RepID=A0A931DZ77_9CORY|nr:hypothetical protein [Corynebacterium aquatimens]MBG6123137.1 hypothetical protein [Corynebacterium aquatimens]